MPLEILLTPTPSTFDGNQGIIALPIESAIDVSCFDELDICLQAWGEDVGAFVVTLLTGMSNRSEVWLPIATFRPPAGQTSSTLVSCVRNPLRLLRFEARVSNKQTGSIFIDGLARRRRSSDFLPSDLPSLAWWLRADSVTEVCNGYPIETWRDSGPRGNDFRQSEAFRKPQFVREALNGGPSVKFDGIDDFMASTVGDFLTDFTFVGLFRQYSGVANSYERLVDKSYINGFWLGREGSASNSWGGGVQEASFPYGEFGFFADGLPEVIVLRRQGNTITLLRGSTLLKTRTVSAAETDDSLYRLAVAYLASLYAYGAVEVFESMTYSSALSDFSLGLANDYLRLKWSLA
ncbi:MAG: hypothetical protein Q8Q09_09665 [Deltaproteobacteria bacterium]|nr:hypothetical protein [Deltaproteobacteria bacterium]